MRDNSSLKRAFKEKNDEFYTQLVDIESELTHYSDQLENQIIYCPFDDYCMSNFVNYFRVNFSKLKLKKLIATNYDIGSGAYKYEYDGVNETITKLEGNGDFASDECTKIKDECDIVISNPPFSKFRSVFKWLMENNSKFLVMGNVCASIYREVFPFIFNNEIWSGYNFNTSCMFVIPDHYKKYDKIVDDVKYSSINIGWFTNLHYTKAVLPLHLHKCYNKIDYKKYDNYDAINVNKSLDIPIDYDGVIGVPISILKYMHSDGKLHFDNECEHYTFEIIGVFNWYKECDYESALLCGTHTEYIDKNGKVKTWNGPTVNRKPIYSRILIKRKQEEKTHTFDE